MTLQNDDFNRIYSQMAIFQFSRNSKFFDFMIFEWFVCKLYCKLTFLDMIFRNFLKKFWTVLKMMI